MRCPGIDLNAFDVDEELLLQSKSKVIKNKKKYFRSKRI